VWPHGLQAAVRQIDRGSPAKGVTVELVEPAPEGNLVTLTSADPTSKPILVHDVALKQADGAPPDRPPISRE